jgi:hypothetical protein
MIIGLNWTKTNVLQVNNYQNDISTLLKNVLTRFLDPQPFLVDSKWDKTWEAATSASYALDDDVNL